MDSAGFLGWSMPWILNFLALQVRCSLDENVGSPAAFFQAFVGMPSLGL